MWELDHREGWALKNRHFWTVVLEKSLESPLDCKEIKPVHQPWIFTGRTDAEAEAPVLGHLLWRAESLEQTLMLGKLDGNKGRGQQKMRWLDSITDSMDMNLSKLGDSDGRRSPMCLSARDAETQTWLRGWTTTINSAEDNLWRQHCIYVLVLSLLLGNL